MSVPVQSGNGGGNKPDPRIFLHIEIRLLPEMLVPHVVIGVDGCSVDADIETVGNRILRIEQDRTLEPLERPITIDAEIPDLKADLRPFIGRKERMAGRLGI
jgi:hypothetical protein